LSEGCMGAPGVPQPEMIERIPRAAGSAAQPSLQTVLIALSV